MSRKPTRRSKNKKGSRNRNNKQVSDFKPKGPKVTEITYYEGITVGELANRLSKNASDVIRVLFMMGTAVTINDGLSDELVELVCLEYEVDATKEEIVDEVSLVDTQEDDPKDLVSRPPVITIMGHVDHGKTSLLDSIRNAKVTDDEFGGITQHIGAYQIQIGGKKGRKLTFLDTPGHEAFTSMRARGAQITDIVVIVVAADDGVMPQTKEALDHARAAKVPMIIAINKMDKPTANPDRVKNELMDLEVMPEEYGGEVPFVEISAHTGSGIDELLETIQLMADLQELTANPKRLATGTVIEARLDKGRGPVATLLVQNGTLNTSSPIVVGTSHGRVRKMVDDKGREIKEALPSTPVEIIGLSDVPEAGDLFKAFEEDKAARSIADSRLDQKIEADRNKSSAISLEDLTQHIQDQALQEIPVVLKADVQGSAEAVKASLERIDVEGVHVNVIRATAGAISESDIMLAAASNAIVYGFNVRPNANVRKKAEEEKVTIRLHNIIYKAVEEMELAMKGMLAPVYEEVIWGQAEVRQLFKVSRLGTIAGSMVTDGKIKRDSKVRLIREGIIVYDGKLGTLRRYENDVKEVAAGYECGITIENFNDIKEGDLIESYGEEEVPVI
ncbi:MAG: translation initiation factor IF-2 [Erysipelothrix sp.]|nr:translation initiation factor IF-2 [Erysipelothrix sp.]